jgi:predicted regulator of Ras-like GTPase activity (Roadblock/LC7/MglB family)
MDFSSHWKQFLSECPEITGGAFLTADGVLISSVAFGTSEAGENAATHCAAVVAIAQQLAEFAERGECGAYILEGEGGHVILMPVLDKAILAVLTPKQIKLGLVLLDMRRAIHEWFGPGLAAEPIFPPRPPKWGTAHARPQDN